MTALDRRAGSGWLELTLDFRSNLRCIGCFACSPPGSDGAGASQQSDAMDLAEVGAWLQWGRARGIENLWLGGGEPTLRPDLGKIVRAAKRMGYTQVLLQTNGLRLGHRPYADAVVRAGVDTVSLNLKSHQPEVHNRLSGRQGAFELLDKACDTLREVDVRLVGDVLLTRSTLPELAETIRYFAAKGVDRFWLWLLSVADTPEGNGSDEDAAARAAVLAEVPSPKAVAAALKPARLAARELGISLKSLHTPHCWLPAEVRDIVWSAAALDLWVANPGQREPMRLEASAMEGGAWLPVCEDCAARVRCGGPRPDTLTLFGDQAFQPIGEAISNAFHYVFEDEANALPWPVDAPCPLLEAATSKDRTGSGGLGDVRALHVLDTDARVLRPARTSTGDFNTAAIGRVKDSLGQLYLDVSNKPAPTDFADDLRQLVEADACVNCPQRTNCGRSFQAAATDVFERDDGAVRRRIGALAGCVLDVGAGHGPYVEQIGPLVEAGQITSYMAIEPHAAEAETLAQRAPWAEIHVAPAEALAVPASTLDHALVLRSYNHLLEPARVLRALVRALKPGGRLMVVDNVAFALVRTARQAQRAEAGPAVFEHTRNDDAEALVALVNAEDFPLEVSARLDVGPGTSNQWLVEFTKR